MLVQALLAGATLSGDPDSSNPTCVLEVEVLGHPTVMTKSAAVQLGENPASE